MAAYVIVDVEVTDPEGFAAYREGAPATVERYGGRYVARGGRIDVLEGDWFPKRVSVLAFDTAEQARAWWESEEYRELKEIRQRTARTNMIIVEGV